ncbi:PREDICTED: uncharacterized protein LOC106892923 [Calidris pugnax]|uniref:uncharacterized protein LOC106892923 n=1 Tax=Calidris pugnax TaxID=198806 RepID=UPI00071E120B|nr:PREDICTED: uncharacterized protein LOC106892923 [Calidris pugnax]
MAKPLTGKRKLVWQSSAGGGTKVPTLSRQPCPKPHEDLDSSEVMYPLLKTDRTSQCQQSLYPRELHRWTSSEHLLDANTRKGKVTFYFPSRCCFPGVGGHLAGTHSFLWPQNASASNEEEEERGAGFKEDLEEFQFLQGQYHAEEKRELLLFRNYTNALHSDLHKLSKLLYLPRCWMAGNTYMPEDLHIARAEFTRSHTPSKPGSDDPITEEGREAARRALSIKSSSCKS